MIHSAKYSILSCVTDSSQICIFFSSQNRNIILPRIARISISRTTEKLPTMFTYMDSMLHACMKCISYIQIMKVTVYPLMQHYNLFKSRSLLKPSSFFPSVFTNGRAVSSVSHRGNAMTERDCKLFCLLSSGN